MYSIIVVSVLDLYVSVLDIMQLNNKLLWFKEKSFVR